MATTDTVLQPGSEDLTAFIDQLDPKESQDLLDQPEQVQMFIFFHY